MATSETKRWLKSETLISISAFLISVATFGLLAYQTKLSHDQNELVRKQQYASVLPYLEVWFNLTNAKKCSLVVVNSGVGPAFVTDVRIQYKGQWFEGDPDQFVEQVVAAEGDTIRNFDYSRVNPGFAIPAGQEIHMLDFVGNPATVNRLAQLFGKNEATVMISYKSVYDETWRVRGIGNPPVKLEKP